MTAPNSVPTTNGLLAYPPNFPNDQVSQAWVDYFQSVNDAINTAPTAIGAVASADLASTSDPAKGDALVGVKSTLTGSVATTQHEVNSRAVSLKDFGAVGDGITDDAAAVQAAIGSGAKVISGVPGKTYAIGAAGLQMASLSGVKFIGNGAGLKFTGVPSQTVTSGGSTQVLMTSCSQVEVSGWVMDGNAKASNQIGMDTCTDCVIRDNRFTSGAVQAQVFSRGGTRNRFLFNICLSGLSATHGLWIGNTNAGDIETDCLVHGNTVSTFTATGIVITAYRGRVTENHVDTITSAGSGIIVSGTATYPSTDIIIANNFIKNVAYHGIQSDMTGTAWSSGIVVSGNICEGAASSGIYVVKADRWAVTGNVCRDNTTSGIDVQLCTNSTITGNACHDTRMAGSRTQVAGIRVLAQTSALEIVNVTVSGNSCENNTQDGVSIQTSGSGTANGVNVSGNSCFSNSRYGIYFSTDAPLISTACTGNNCYGNTTSDLRAANLDNTIIANRCGAIDLNTNYTLTVNSTTPAVGPGARQFFKCANSIGTTVTNFTGGTEFREIEVLFSNGNTTVSHGTILLKGATNVTPAANSVMRFRYFNTNWYEVSRNF